MEHINKGCFADPLPPHEMSYVSSGDPPTDGGPPRKCRRRGTNVVENNNRHAKERAIGKSRRQTSNLTQRKFLIFVFLHNLNTDARIQHITGKVPLSRDWFVREALRGSVQHLVHSPMYSNDRYPPLFDKRIHMEPIGEYYQLWEEWDRMTRTLKIHYDYQRTKKRIDVPLTCCPCFENDAERTTVTNRSGQMAINDEAATLNSPCPSPDAPAAPTAAAPPTNLPTPPPTPAPTNGNGPTPPPTTAPTNGNGPTPAPNTGNLPTPPSTPAPTNGNGPTPIPTTSPDVFGDSSFLDDFDVDAAIEAAVGAAAHSPPAAAAATVTTNTPPPENSTHLPMPPPALIRHYQHHLRQLDCGQGGDDVGDEQARFSQRLQNHNNIGYSSTKWGTRKSPVSKSTLYNTYIPRGGRLTQLQMDQLDNAQGEVHDKYGFTVSIQQRSQLVADLFNANHLSAGGVGFGGLISPKRVELESNRRVNEVQKAKRKTSRAV